MSQWKSQRKQPKPPRTCCLAFPIAVDLIKSTRTRPNLNWLAADLEVSPRMMISTHPKSYSRPLGPTHQGFPWFPQRNRPFSKSLSRSRPGARESCSTQWNRSPSEANLELLASWETVFLLQQLGDLFQYVFSFFVEIKKQKIVVIIIWPSMRSDLSLVHLQCGTAVLVTWLPAMLQHRYTPHPGRCQTGRRHEGTSSTLGTWSNWFTPM